MIIICDIQKCSFIHEGAEGQKTLGSRASEPEKDDRAARVEYTLELTVHKQELDYETMRIRPFCFNSQLWDAQFQTCPVV